MDNEAPPKTEARARARALLSAQSPETFARVGENAARAIKRAGLLDGCSLVLLFAPLPGEPDPGPIARVALALGASIGLPRGADPGAGFSFASFPFRLVRSGRILVPDPDMPIAGLEGRRELAVIVPGLLFSESGARLGRGGGWYDRALASFNPGALVIGLCLEAQIAPSLPLEPHDRLMTFIATEDRLICCERSGPA